MHKMMIPKMIMLKCMLGKIRNDRIMNIKIMSYLGIVPIKDKIRE